MSPTISIPGQARVLRAFGDELTVLLDGDQTGGKLALGIAVTPPGGGPPPHYHLNEDETFIVQEGRVSFFHDNRWDDVPVGTTVFIPRTAVHTFKNIGTTPSRMLVATSPAGFEKFFARCAEEFAKAGGPDMARIITIATEHGIHFV